MKRNPIPKPAFALMAIGLLLVSLMPIVARHFAIPDFARGFVTGLGLTLEVIALVKMQRSRCRKSNEI